MNAKFIEFLPWDMADFEMNLRDLLVRQCKRKLVLIVNDKVEQHYRKERVPKVGIMDRANVLNRRLNMAFPNYKIRAALKLDDKKSGLSKDGKGMPYLFAAISASDNFSKTINAVKVANVSILGFYLLPIEASSMVKALSSKLSKGKKASWTIFIGQHHSGGVRQVVTRDGELALTRMSPIVDTDVEPELWAQEMSTELSATMSYLSRFGYNEADGLNVIVVSNESTHSYLDSAINVECNLEMLTSQQAGKVLGLNVGPQSDLRYADPVHVAYLGRKSKFRLPMQVTAIDSMTKPRQAATFLALALLAGCCYFGYVAVMNWTKTIGVKEDLRVSAERKKSVQQEYDLELAKKKEVGFDFILVSNSVEVFNDVEKQRIMPLPILKKIGNALGTDIHLDKLTLKAGDRKEKQKVEYDQDGVEIKNKLQGKIIDAVLTFSFDSSVDPDLGVQKTNGLRARIQQQLPNYDVNIIKQVADLSYTGNFQGESGTRNSDGEAQDYEAEISLRGPVR